METRADLDAHGSGVGWMPLSVKRVLLAGFVVYMVLLSFNSLTRLRRFVSDSMSYVCMAEQIKAGEGITHPMHLIATIDDMADAREPRPVTDWPPLYPILIAAVSYAGVSTHDSALLVASGSCALLFVGIFLLVRRLYDAPAALLVVTALTLYEPLHVISVRALSETTGMACVVFALYFLTDPRRTVTGTFLAPLAAGLLCGLAFATRYALLSVVAVGVVALVTPGDRKRTWRALAMFSVGFVLVVAPVLVRNIAVSSEPLGAGRPASDRGLLTNITDLYMVCAGYFVPRQLVPTRVQIPLFWLFIGIGLIQFVRRTRGSRRAAAVHEAVLAEKRYIVGLWVLVYSGTLLYLRTTVFFDPIGARLAAPGLVFLLVLLVASLAHAQAPRGRTVAAVALVLLGLGVAKEIVVAAHRPVSDFEQRVASSERLCWIGERTTARDLIIGEDMGPIPFYFGARPVVHLYARPFASEHLRRSSLMDYAEHYGDQYDRILLVTKRGDHRPSEEQWRSMVGGFVTGVVLGGVDADPKLECVAELEDGRVFQVHQDALDGS